MFASPCTLRSASCAALIALAAAAGIVRAPEPAARPSAPPPVPAEVIAIVHHVTAAELRLVRRPRPALSAHPSLLRFAVLLTAPPERLGSRGVLSHRLPFAVGPPAF